MAGGAIGQDEDRRRERADEGPDPVASALRIPGLPGRRGRRAERRPEATAARPLRERRSCGSPAKAAAMRDAARGAAARDLVRAQEHPEQPPEVGRRSAVRMGRGLARRGRPGSDRLRRAARPGLTTIGWIPRREPAARRMAWTDPHVSGFLAAARDPGGVRGRAPSPSRAAPCAVAGRMATGAPTPQGLAHAARPHAARPAPHPAPLVMGDGAGVGSTDAASVDAEPSLGTRAPRRTRAEAPRNETPGRHT